MLLDLRFSIFTLGITAGTFVAALYGMNLKNFIEESDLGFAGISAWCSVFGAFVCIYGLRKLRSVQRVSMWGEAGRKLAMGSQTEVRQRRDAGERMAAAVSLPSRNFRFWERQRRRVVVGHDRHGLDAKTAERAQHHQRREKAEKQTGTPDIPEGGSTSS